jgi:hypothetical protein
MVEVPVHRRDRAADATPVVDDVLDGSGGGEPVGRLDEPVGGAVAAVVVVDEQGADVAPVGVLDERGEALDGVREPVERNVEDVDQRSASWPG